MRRICPRPRLIIVKTKRNLLPKSTTSPLERNGNVWPKCAILVARPATKTAQRICHEWGKSSYNLSSKDQLKMPANLIIWFFPELSHRDKKYLYFGKFFFFFFDFFPLRGNFVVHPKQLLLRWLNIWYTTKDRLHVKYRKSYLISGLFLSYKIKILW